jgi:hypothetical protein
VHLISGLMETKVQGAIPVVGGSAPGYQPLVSTPHLGALLQITTSLLPGDDAALVDLHSSLTRWEEEDDPVKLNGIDDSGDPVVQVDRLKVSAQQLATSLRVPLGKPVLVGGMTNAARGGQGVDAVDRIYLIVEITAPEAE